MRETGSLAHELVTLEPLREEHIAGMTEAALPTGQIAEFASVPTPETAEAWVRTSLQRAEAGESLPYAVLTEGRVVGHTAFLSPRRWPGAERLYAIEIGSSYLHPSVQGTAVNTAAKLLLMTQAFETWEVARLDIKTDARNDRARAGIRAVGARFEGILRGWQPSQAPAEAGRMRDTAMHAVIAADWPELKAALEVRVAAKTQAPTDSRRPTQDSSTQDS